MGNEQWQLKRSLYTRNSDPLTERHLHFFCLLFIFISSCIRIFILFCLISLYNLRTVKFICRIYMSNTEHNQKCTHHTPYTMVMGVYNEKNHSKLRVKYAYRKTIEGKWKRKEMNVWGNVHSTQNTKFKWVMQQRFDIETEKLLNNTKISNNLLKRNEKQFIQHTNTFIHRESIRWDWQTRTNMYIWMKTKTKWAKRKTWKTNNDI